MSEKRTLPPTLSTSRKKQRTEMPRRAAPAPRKRTTAIARRRPTRRKTTGPRLSRAATIYGRLFDRKKRQEKLAAELAEIAGNNPSPLAEGFFDEANEAYKQRIVGRGKYKFGKHAQKFLQGRVGTALRDRAVGFISGADSFGGSGMYTGRGSYVSNHLVNDAIAPGMPGSFISEDDEESALILSNTEYIKDIYGLDTTENFHLDALRLNPGLVETLPWASQIAANYEEYEFVQLLFHFESKISDQLGGTNGQVGSIIMFTDYGPDSKLKTSKNQMLQGYGSGDSLVTEDQVHGVECDPRKLHGDGHKFVRTRDPGSSLIDYDLGIFQIAVTGTPDTLANQIIGQLSCTYTLKLRKKRLYTSLGYAIQRDEFVTSEVQRGIYDTFPMGSGLGKLLAKHTNSIGCKVEQVNDAHNSPGFNISNGDLQVIRITFPASFSGPVEIGMYIQGVDNSLTWDASTGSGNIGAGNLTNVTATNAITDYGYAVKGNIVRNLDMATSTFDATDNVANQPFWITQGTYANGAYFLAHLHVETADSGVDNWIQFPLQVASANVSVINGSLVISRYNSQEVVDDIEAVEKMWPEGAFP